MQNIYIHMQGTTTYNTVIQIVSYHSSVARTMHVFLPARQQAKSEGGGGVDWNLRIRFNFRMVRWHVWLKCTAIRIIVNIPKITISCACNRLRVRQIATRTL